MDLHLDVPPHVAETIKAIALLHAEHHRKSTIAERVVDRATEFVGRPIFLVGIFALALLWTAANLGFGALGSVPLDPPPFAWMELALTATAFFIAVMILTSQLRADKFANLREQMTLEATLLTEQKTRKIVEFLEELRRDLPGVRDRHDLEAEQMSAKADPSEVLAVIEDITPEPGNEGLSSIPSGG